MTETFYPKSNVTLKMLIDSGILTAGSDLVCPHPDITGTLNKDGTIKVFMCGREKHFQSLSGAAKHIENVSINGWTYWSIIINDVIYNLSGFRDQYLKMKKEL